MTICVVHFFQPGLDICFIFVLFLLTWVGGEALSFGGFLSNASPSRGKLRIGFMFLQRDLIFSKNNLLMFKNYLIQTSFDFFRHTRNPSRTQFSASAQSIQQKPIKKRQRPFHYTSQQSRRLSSIPTYPAGAASSKLNYPLLVSNVKVLNEKVKAHAGEGLKLIDSDASQHRRRELDRRLR